MKVNKIKLLITACVFAVTSLTCVIAQGKSQDIQRETVLVGAPYNMKVEADKITPIDGGIMLEGNVKSTPLSNVPPNDPEPIDGGCGLFKNWECGEPYVEISSDGFGNKIYTILCVGDRGKCFKLHSVFF